MIFIGVAKHPPEYYPSLSSFFFLNLCLAIKLRIPQAGKLTVLRIQEKKKIKK
jgi:hypothetical protein